MKYYTVIFDGIDRSGKTSMRYYLGKMSGHRLITYDRGIISNMAWDIMMGRPVSFNASVSISMSRKKTGKYAAK